MCCRDAGGVAVGFGLHMLPGGDRLSMLYDGVNYEGWQLHRCDRWLCHLHLLGEMVLLLQSAKTYMPASHLVQPCGIGG